MDSTNGQSAWTNTKRDTSTHTRQRLLNAAAELIAERGWGQVTTRAIAERAGLPHGTVSYHFQGKQELLTEAALHTIESLFPMSELAAIKTLDELIPLIKSWLGDQNPISPVSIGVLTEAMRESKHNPTLRHRLAIILREYRRTMAEVVSTEQLHGTIASGPAPSALATLIAAVGDGLLLHVLLDPELNVAEAIEALLALLRR
jgi:AcrR family transcriptional regulator